jgi:hypothetical protein
MTEAPKSATDSEENNALTYSNPFQLFKVFDEFAQKAPKYDVLNVR